MAVTPWKSSSDVVSEIGSSDLVEPKPLRKRRAPGRRIAPTQFGLDMAESAIERLEPLTPLALVLYGAAIVTVYGAPIWLWAVLAMVFIFSVVDILLGISLKPEALHPRAIVALCAGAVCFWASGGPSSPFFVWLLVCVCIYPLLLTRFVGSIYVLAAVVICLIGQWLTSNPPPALELLTRCGLLSFLGLLMHALGVRLKSFEHFQNLANIDSLTQVSTRRRFFECAERDFQRCSELGHRITVMVFDLDSFKEINDNYGHSVGDEVLRRFGKCLRRYARPTDIVGRLGGDEFAMILPGTGLRGANDLQRRLTIRLSQESVKLGNGDSVPLKTSAGVATMDEFTQNLEELMELADRDLYRQKLAGNRRIGKVSKKILKPRAA